MLKKFRWIRLFYLVPELKGKFTKTLILTLLWSPEILARTGIEKVQDFLRLLPKTHELKSVQDPEEREEILFGSMRVDSGQIKGRSVLLVDDLYRSGATMTAATNIVLEQGGAKFVYVFAITRTRVHQ